MSGDSPFDAWMEERVEGDPLPITIRGVEFFIPAEPPWAWLKFSAKATDDSVPEDDRVTNADLVRAQEALFAREVDRDRDGAPKPSAGKKVWRDFAESIGVVPPDDATRDLIRAVCARKVQQLDEFDALGLDANAVAALLLSFVPLTYGLAAGNSDASDAA